jgi:hypothetical protein
LALPRWAMGALPLAVAMKVVKLVMSSATDEQSSPDSPMIRTVRRRLISSRAARDTACIASQNRR